MKLGYPRHCAEVFARNVGQSASSPSPSTLSRTLVWRGYPSRGAIRPKRMSFAPEPHALSRTCLP